ncbi:MAG: hypothetical protein IKA41_09230 [Bacteroidaceae bacterium]|nr:hypothetical protein [Bacteroidaceae bacterium]
MNKRQKYIFATMAFLLLMAFAGKMLLVYIFPQYNFSLYWVVPLFFICLYGTTFTIVLKHTSNFLQSFMAFKTIKLIASLFTMLISAFAFRSQAANLLVTFLIYYLVMMIPETLYSAFVRKMVMEDNK